ncbi:MAG: hypothetical protein PF447_11000 [Spirochaetaceae bacterium]|jgi:hypothetical protein|nr:hypothetical protein [Spirochaetaceae bacterium]
MAKSVIDNKLNLLSTRAGFNQALRHFKTALGFSEDISQGYNLADILNEALENQELENHQIIPIINILLADKFGYKSKSENLDSILNDLKNLSTTVKTWNLINFIMVCYSSDGTPQVVNPANIEALDSLLPLNSGELVVCYAGSNYIEDDSIIKAALEDFIKLLYGGKIKGKKAYMDDNTNVEASKPEAPVSSKLVSSNISKKYGVVVTNELFHNGNVEAWKRIIESYVTAHSGCDVLVWYEGERINDINALFKWGKVKRGCPIMFSVVGESLKNISKLKKYLFEGASSRYEVFLRGQVGAVLDLF